MQLLYLLAIIFIFLALLELLVKKKPSKQFRYKLKESFLTPAEKVFYITLKGAIGESYTIFAQVHLSSLIDFRIIGQNWNAAKSHIDRKSVDFVLFDKNIAPKLVIELDDRSHESEKRKERDRIVNEIFNQIGLPILRIKNKPYTSEELLVQINEALV